MIEQTSTHDRRSGPPPQYNPDRCARAFTTARTRVVGEIDSTLGQVDPEEAARFVREVLAARRISVLAAGRSRLSVEAFAMRLMHMGFDAHVAQDVTAPAVGPGDLVLACSGSGATPGVVRMARNGADSDCRVVTVTGNPGSELAGLSDFVVDLTEYGADRAPRSSEQFVGTLFEQSAYLFFDCSVIALESLGYATKEEMVRRHTNLE
ncbi:SIS domain-containing protein [Nocardiopsis sp. HNM0947]|uniref:SIS domain-containing protein n=1 Tax=Nocardiopsis coralli TaxID=2772213 RepID=A0ABR9P0N4_9ACTN|nr:6-phospho-3-hexuloisomerase [Nocardiopsis coralli]MBE2997414.1 SIS domain-containing protein [Nocardiopsis coralli]